jgi:hypothetical protein
MATPFHLRRHSLGVGGVFVALDFAESILGRYSQ